MNSADRITMLKEEVELLRKRKEEDMYITYTIMTLERRVKELEEEHKEIIKRGYISSYEYRTKNKTTKKRMVLQK